MKPSSGKPFLIVIAAVAVLATLSLIPWSRLTGGQIKDFSLLSDITGGSDSDSAPAMSTELVDPELAEALAHAEAEPETASRASRSSDADSVVAPSVLKDAVNPRQGDAVIFEDYTAAGQGLANLRRALADKSRTARIAFIGDSYIEGDILTQNIRKLLQDRFGGSGVGYMPLSSMVANFRTSVRQSSNGWTEHDIRKKSSDAYKWLSGEYFTSSAKASSTFKGSSKLPHLGSWDSTSLLFISPSSGSVSITTDAGTRQFPVQGSDAVQCLSVPGNTKSATITSEIPGLQALAAYLDGTGGIAVDNMSLRGNSGITHRKINPDLISQMRRFRDYDLIVLEFGINALTAEQSNYNGYSSIMVKVLNRIRQCYPNADILLMGIGDRGHKVNGQVKSLATAPNMVAAQRDAARKAGVLFWDTREAMGGDDAVVSWRDRGLINADYIHLNSKGGAVLADEFVKSLNLAL